MEPRCCRSVGIFRSSGWNATVTSPRALGETSKVKLESPSLPAKFNGGTVDYGDVIDGKSEDRPAECDR